MFRQAWSLMQESRYCKWCLLRCVDEAWLARRRHGLPSLPHTLRRKRRPKREPPFITLQNKPAEIRRQSVGYWYTGTRDAFSHVRVTLSGSSTVLLGIRCVWQHFWESDNFTWGNGQLHKRTSIMCTTWYNLQTVQKQVNKGPCFYLLWRSPWVEVEVGMRVRRGFFFFF